MDIIRGFFFAGLIIVFSSCSPKTSSSVFPELGSQASNNCAGSFIRNSFVVTTVDGQLEFYDGPTVENFVKDFVEPNLDRIEKVEFNKLIQQPELQVQSAEVSSSSSLLWQHIKMNTSAAWDKGNFGQGVTVAIVDAPIWKKQPQLINQIYVNTAELNGSPGVDDDNNGYVDDVRGFDFFKNTGDFTYPTSNNLNEDSYTHGTHVTGIIAANPDEGSAQGIAPLATILPINFMDGKSGDMAGAARSLEYARKMGAKIVNASWGGTQCYTSLSNAVSQLESAGILFVSAAGNDGTDFTSATAGKYNYPAVFYLPHQLTVAATGLLQIFDPQRSGEALTSFSNRGRFVHLAAPGDSITSTTRLGVTGSSGTSMAAPMVSGVAALLWNDRPQASVYQIRQALIEGVDPLGLNVDSKGRVSVSRALTRLRQLVP
jgi:subtilisin family serine protease